MTTILSTIATWGPTAWFSFKIANQLFGPSILKYQSGSSSQAIDVFPEVFEKVEKLRKDIVFYTTPNVKIAVPVGTNFGPNAIIFINDELFSMKGEELNFICKHEISHINTNDEFIASTLAATVSAIATYAIPYLQSFLPWWAAPIPYCVPFLVGYNVLIGVMAFSEYRADSFASNHATPEELLGWERFLRGLIEVNKSLHPKFPYLFSQEGDLRFNLNLSHPHYILRHRIAKFECRVRNIIIDETSDEEIKKLHKIKEFLLNSYRKFEKFKID